MKKEDDIGLMRVASGAAAVFLFPVLLHAQAVAAKSPEKPRVVEMDGYKVNAPPGTGWQIERVAQNNMVIFTRSREGFMPGQERSDIVAVMPQIANIYGWRSTEEDLAESILLEFAEKLSRYGPSPVPGTVDWDGKKLHVLNSVDTQGGTKRVSVVFLYFPPDIAKSHRYFEFDFVYGRGALRLSSGDPSLEPVRSVIGSLEIVDPLQAIPGPHGDLVRAAAAGSADGVIQAIEKGADINAGGPGRGALSAAAFYGRREIVDLLLEKGARVDTPDAVGGMTPLLAAIIGREPEIAQLLVAKGADVNRKISAGGGSGVSALMFAVAIGHLKLARVIIDAGARLEERTVLGETALILAADNGWAEGAALLLERGAAIDARMSNGWTALMRAVVKGRSEAIELLLEKKADINLKATGSDSYGDWNGWTALVFAVRQANADIVKTLIEHGADVNARSEGFGESVLHVAALQNLPEIAGMLIEAGAEINAKAEDGRTALIEAAEAGFADIVKLLIGKGADITIRDKKSQTALMAAKKNKHADIVKLLQAAGAKW